MKYKKTLEDLEKVAVKWWPKELETQAAESSVIPKLLETQDKFISILKLSGQSPEQIFDVINAGDLPANLFLKHLVILSDYGGELIKRLGKEFGNTFSKDKNSGLSVMDFAFRGKNYKYTFKAMPVKALSNDRLKIDGASIVVPTALDALSKDLIMILLFGGASTASDNASLERCELGGLIGKTDEIDLYVKQKYIHVSRITTGASETALVKLHKNMLLII
jgi:hypothetical protein